MGSFTRLDLDDYCDRVFDLGRNSGDETMTYAEAKRTALKLFGPGTALMRTDKARRCLVLNDRGVPFGDGKSWLEALRSAGTFRMLQNEVKAKEAQRFKERFEEFAKTTGWDTEKLNEEQLLYFDVWMACKEKGEEPPPVPAIEAEKPLVTLK